MSDTQPLFSGSFSELYDRHMVPLLFQDYAVDLARRVPCESGGRILEIACGTGVASAALRDAHPENVSIVATDVSPDMLAHAEAKMNGVAGIEFQHADGTDLPFEDEAFDGVACQFGVMFFPDKTAGYREAFRVLKPGGSFVFNTWDAIEHNPVGSLAFEIAAELFPDDPPVFMQMPFGYYDTDTIRAELEAAGFSDIEIETVPGTSRAPSPEAAATAITHGTPLAAILIERGIEERARDAIRGAYEHAFGPGEFAAPMRAIVVTARRPN